MFEDLIRFWPIFIILFEALFQEIFKVLVILNNCTFIFLEFGEVLKRANSTNYLTDSLHVATFSIRFATSAELKEHTAKLPDIDSKGKEGV